MLSGYVMTILIHQSYGQFGKSTIFFYADRALRIYPQYLLFLVIAQAADLYWNFNFQMLSDDPSPWAFFLNSLIVPVNYPMYIPTLANYTLIPSAWSLALEEQFYWIFPMLVLIAWTGRVAVVVATFGSSLA